MRKGISVTALALFAPLVGAAPEPAPAVKAETFSRAEPLSLFSVTELAFALLLVLAAIAVTAWMLRRLNAFYTPAGGAMKVVGGLSVGQRERVVLIQVGETQLLLGVAPGRVETLHVLEQPLEVQPLELPPFAERLAALMKKDAKR